MKEDLTNTMVSSEELVEIKMFCPICKESLKGWLEGCTLIHLICKKCGVHILLINTKMFAEHDIIELKMELENIIQKFVS
ncbi:MAG: hypothetical protein NDF54_09930 [archaeon GB-1867-035]|nr:hypothetical protein [Candidatus Culexmicrobium profundum]